MNISEAWKKAELTCYTALITAIANSKDNVNCFRGFLTDERDCWMFTSGGQQTGPIDRTYGTTGAWCTLAFKARVECMYQDRDMCLDLAGQVMKFLVDTNNLNKKANVMWLRLTDYPQEPTIVEIPIAGGAKLVWNMVIPLEMVVTTTGEYTT